jgi:hypothetical protein
MNVEQLALQCGAAKFFAKGQTKPQDAYIVSHDFLEKYTAAVEVGLSKRYGIHGNPAFSVEAVAASVDAARAAVPVPSTSDRKPWCLECQNNVSKPCREDGSCPMRKPT